MADRELNIIDVTDADIEQKISSFSDLLRDIESLDDKKRELWKQIYEAAVTDRQNAYVVFGQLFNIVNGKTTEYAVHGRTMTACIERMSKSNDQLIRLAELIAKAQGGADELDPEAMFERIRGS